MAGLRERIEGMEPREQKLLAVLGGTFTIMVLLLIPLGVMTLLSQRRTENEELHAAIDELYQQRERIAENKAQNEQVLSRYKVDAPELAGFLTKLAEANSIEIPEIKDRPPVPVGKKYEERSKWISLRKVGMLNFLKFLESIVQAKHPVSISKLNIKKNTSPPDNYDVQMTVSSFHLLQSKEKKGGKKPEEQQEASGEDKRDEEEE